MTGLMRCLVLLAVLIGWHAPAACALVAAQDRPAAEAAPQDRFETPEAAAAALRLALSRDDTEALLDMFGRDHADLVLGTDPASGREMRRQAADFAAQRLSLRRQPDGRISLVLGKAGWPMPIPLVHRPEGWVFDTDAGADEMLARRIGEDELSAIASLRAFVRAQRNYAERLRTARKPVR